MPAEFVDRFLPPGDNRAVLYRRILEKGAIPILLLVLGGATAMGLFIPKLRTEAGTDVMLNQADPDLAYYNASRISWNTTDEYVIFCCTRDDWFTENGRTLLLSFVDEASKLPSVRKVKGVPQVDSIVNAVPLLRVKPSPLPSPMAFGAETFFLDDKRRELPPPERLKRLDLARKELLDHNLARGNLVSDNGRDISVLAYLDIPSDVEKLEPRRNQLLGQKRTPEVQKELDAIEPPYRAAIIELNVRRKALVDASRQLAKTWSPRMAEPIRLAGIPILNRNIIEHVDDDVSTFGIISLLAFALTFVAIYRKLRWIVFPIIACVIPVVIVLGLMVLTDNRMTVITSNLPVLVFILTLPYAVYLVERYRERRSLFPNEDAATVSSESSRDIWVPCLYSATTTMAGTASLMTSGIIPVKTFGLMATLGMALTLVTIFLFLAACFRMLPTLAVTGAGVQSGVIPPLRPVVGAVLKAPAIVIIGGLGILGVAVWGTTKVTAENKVIDYFWPKSETYVGLEYVDTRMGGTTPLEIILRAEPGHFKSKAGLDTIQRVADFFKTVPETGNVRSLPALTEEVRKGYPKMKPESAVNLLMTLAYSTTRELVTDDFSTARVLIRMKETAPTLNRKNILDALAAHLNKPEFAHLAERRPTGVFLLYSNLLQDLLQSQKDTFLMVLVAIWLMLVILFIDIPGMKKGVATALILSVVVLTEAALGAILWRQGRPLVLLTETEWVLPGLGISLAAMVIVVAIWNALRRQGLLATAGWTVKTLGLPSIVLVPQILPVFIVLGIMGFFHIALDMVTTMIASMAMGVGIDAAIQYTVRYRIELDATGDPAEAVRRSHATIGRSILIATSIVFAGFLVLGMSKFVPTVWFGLFTGLAMLMGLFASLTILPSFFVLLKFPKARKPS